MNRDYIANIQTKYVIFNNEMNIAVSGVKYLGSGSGRWIETNLYDEENNLFEISFYLNLLNENFINSLLKDVLHVDKKKEKIEMDLYLEYSKINPKEFTMKTFQEVVKAELVGLEIESSSEGDMSYIVNLQFSI